MFCRNIWFCLFNEYIVFFCLINTHWSSCCSGCFKRFAWIIDVRSIIKQSIWVDVRGIWKRFPHAITILFSTLAITWSSYGATSSCDTYNLRNIQRWRANLVQETDIFQFQFLIHMLVYVLCEPNKLMKKFQYDLMDITSIGSELEVCISVLRKLFLCGTWPPLDGLQWIWESF